MEVAKKSIGADEDEQQSQSRHVDWRGRASNPLKHGGMRAAAFVLGLQGFEIMAIAGVGNNLITYVINEMHFSLSKSANTVTNFIGTVFILALLGGYLSDCFLGCFWTILILGFVELSGFILLSVQAHLPQLKPAECDMLMPSSCEEAKGMEALIFFIALYLVALGSGCVKPNMIAHGADQFTHSHNLSTYFNAAYFAFSIGQLVALTLLVYLQTHSGMDLGFGLSALAMAIGLILFVSATPFYTNKPPQSSILTPIAQVVVAATYKRKAAWASDPAGMQLDGMSSRFGFLNKACIRRKKKSSEWESESPWKVCSVEQVEQVKTLITVVPIFACTIIFNTILAQLQTFSVQQGSSMDTHLTGSFHIPPASLQSIPYAMLLLFVPLYDRFLVPFARTYTGHPSGITPLQRIGVGLFLATFSMVSAALMERRRRDAALHSNHTLSIFWITPQFLIFGLSEMFTAVGLIEFFYKQSTAGNMQAFLTAITYCSYSFGFYLSSLLVSLVNKLTSHGHHAGWLSDNDLNKDRLDLFYWFLALLSFLNFLNYLFWSKWYLRLQSPSHQPPNSITDTTKDDDHDNMININNNV